MGNGVGRGEVTPGSAPGPELWVILERAMHAPMLGMFCQVGRCEQLHTCFKLKHPAVEAFLKCSP